MLFRSLGGGECYYCHNSGSYPNMNRQFAVWVYVDFIAHLGNNPDPNAPNWPTIDVPVPGGGGMRTYFKEEVKDVRVLQLRSGKEQSRFNQFMNMFTRFGSLQTMKYTLTRRGESLDTEYELAEMQIGRASCRERV